MVKAGWFWVDGRQLFAVRCQCGSEHVSPLLVPVVAARAPSSGSTAAERRTERLVWAAFVSHAREGRCADCQKAAGRWLRQEPGAALPLASA